ncbi:MAG: hypothetical protein QXK88_04235 [Desulfurococcaceae archaeon]
MEKRIPMFLLALLATSFIAGSVFAYYPFQLVVQPVEPPIKFLLGSNAGQKDLGNKEIQVNIGSDSTSAGITVHPTYQTTYYKNLTLISNTDSKAYNVYLILDQMSGSIPAGSKVWLIVYDYNATRDLPASYPQPGEPSGAVRVIELTSTNTNNPQQIGALSGNSMWEVDLMVYIPEGTSISGQQATFNMHLVYTPSSEIPP